MGNGQEVKKMQLLYLVPFIPILLVLLVINWHNLPTRAGYCHSCKLRRVGGPFQNSTQVCDPCAIDIWCDII